MHVDNIGDCRIPVSWPKQTWYYESHKNTVLKNYVFTVFNIMFWTFAFQAKVCMEIFHHNHFVQKLIYFEMCHLMFQDIDTKSHSKGI